MGLKKKVKTTRSKEDFLNSKVDHSIGKSDLLKEIKSRRPLFKKSRKIDFYRNII